MKNIKAKKVLGVIMLLISVVILGTRLVKTIEFKNNVTSYLKRATSASSVELALQDIAYVVDYLEEKDMVGHTSIFWNTPNEDVGFWFKNLKQTKLELESLKGASLSDETNALLKLRGTLLEDGKKGKKILMPKGMAVFPNNRLWFFLVILAGVLGFIGYFLAFRKSKKETFNIVKS